MSKQETGNRAEQGGGTWSTGKALTASVSTGLYPDFLYSPMACLFLASTTRTVSV